MLSSTEIVERAKHHSAKREEANQRRIEGFAVDLFDEMKSECFGLGSRWYIEKRLWGLRKRYYIKKKFLVEIIWYNLSEKLAKESGKAAVDRFFTMIWRDEHLSQFEYTITNERYRFNFFAFDLKITIKEFPPKSAI
jgi:hypothetical protein